MSNPDLASALNDLGARIKRQQVSPTTRDPYLVASFERVLAAVVATCDELRELTKRIESWATETTSPELSRGLNVSSAAIVPVVDGGQSDAFRETDTTRTDCATPATPAEPRSGNGAANTEPESLGMRKVGLRAKRI